MLGYIFLTLALMAAALMVQRITERQERRTDQLSGVPTTTRQ